MIDLIYAFLGSAYWDYFTAAALLWGLTGIVMLLLGGAGTRSRKAIAWGGIAVMTLGVIFSMLFEDLVPLADQRTDAETIAAAIGMLVFLGAPALFAYGGFILVRDTFRRLGELPPERPRKGKPAIGAGEWLTVWRGGCLLLLGAVLLFLLGAAFYHGGVLTLLPR